MPTLKQTGKFISDNSPENIKFEEHDDGIIHIVQGTDVISVHTDEFKSFLKLAGEWFVTSEIHG